MTEHPPRDLAYDAKLEARVLEVLRTGPKSLGSVVSGSEGAYPTEVLETLRKLQEAGSVTKTEENVWLNVGCGNEQNELQIERDFPPPSREVPLPEPHPLDFDWRFDLRTLDFLNRLVEEITGKK